MKEFLLKCICLLCLTSISIVSYSDSDGTYNYNMDETCLNIPDPFESINRKIFYFNAVLDYVILEPLARMYDVFTNDFTKDRVRGFVNNVQEPFTTVNYAVQLKPRKSLDSLWKFIINSTLGIGGLFDVAAKFGINVEKQNFGSTLAYYGIGTGPYIMLPFIGSSSIRDMLDPIILYDRTNLAMYFLSENQKKIILAADVVDLRAGSLKFSDRFKGVKIDPYVLIRNMYHQSREAKLHYPKGYNCNWAIPKSKRIKSEKDYNNKLN